MRFGIENLHAKGPIANRWDVLLRVVCDFAIVTRYPHRAVVHEGEFCVVEFALQLAAWLDTPGEPVAFVYTSLESETEGIIRFEHDEGRRWRVVVARPEGEAVCTASIGEIRLASWSFLDRLHHALRAWPGFHEHMDDGQRATWGAIGASPSSVAPSDPQAVLKVLARVINDGAAGAWAAATAGIDRAVECLAASAPSPPARQRAVSAFKNAASVVFDEMRGPKGWPVIAALWRAVRSLEDVESPMHPFTLMALADSTWFAHEDMAIALDAVAACVRWYAERGRAMDLLHLERVATTFARAERREDALAWARTVFEAAMKEEGGARRMALRTVADIHAQFGTWEDAARCLALVRASEREDSDVHPHEPLWTTTELAVALFHLDRRDEAWRALEEVIALAKTAKPPWRATYWTLYDHGREPGEGAKEIAALMAAHPDCADDVERVRRRLA